MDLIEKYCRDDVKLTGDLYEFGKNHGHVLYMDKGDISELKVEWP